MENPVSFNTTFIFLVFFDVQIEQFMGFNFDLFPSSNVLIVAAL